MCEVKKKGNPFLVSFVKLRRRLAWPLRKDDTHKSRQDESGEGGVEAAVEIGAVAGRKFFEHLDIGGVFSRGCLLLKAALCVGYQLDLAVP